MDASMFATSASRRCGLVAAVALLALASCSSDKAITSVGSSTSTSTSATGTTALDATVTTLDPSATTIVAAPTTVPTPPPTTAPPPAPPPPPPPPTLPPPTLPPAIAYASLGAGRMVAHSDASHVFPVGSITCSAGMSFDYGEVEQCVEQGDLMVISYRIPEAKRVVEAYVKVGSSWTEKYSATEDFDFELSAVALYIGDYAGIGHPSAFVGYRIEGTGHFLDFDIVQSRGDGSLEVRGMRGLDHGNIGLPSAEPGVVVSAVFAGSDPNCCPTSMLYQGLAYVGGAWSIDTGTLYPSASAPVVAFAF